MRDVVDESKGFCEGFAKGVLDANSKSSADDEAQQVFENLDPSVATTKAVAIEIKPHILINVERTIKQGWSFTNADERHQSLLDNLEMFKEASDALIIKMDSMEPDWENMDYDKAVMHMNRDFRRAYRAWRRARAGIDSTLATLADDNRKRLEKNEIN